MELINNEILYPRFIQNSPCGIDKFEGGSQGRLTQAIANFISVICCQMRRSLAWIERTRSTSSRK